MAGAVELFRHRKVQRYLLPFPTTTETARVIYDSTTDKPWPTVLYLTPVSTAGGWRSPPVP